MDFYLLVIALALQLQTILGEQLASDDQAADVVVISLGDGIARVYGWRGVFPTSPGFETQLVQNGVSTHLAGLTSVVVASFAGGLVSSRRWTLDMSAILTFSVRYNVGVGRSIACVWDTGPGDTCVGLFPD